MRPERTCRLALAIGLVAGSGRLAAQELPRPGEALEAEIPRLLESSGVPGLQAALVLDGRVAWTGAFGVADEATGAPVTDRTVYQAASLSKQVFAYTALRLIERGVLDLDTPLAEHLPNERMAHDPRYRRITARLVLSHSTGLPNWGGDRLELDFDPGDGFRYSGEGYVYLQRALERLTGKGLATLVDEEVLAPLGLADSWMTWRPAFEDRAAARHDEWGRSEGVARREEENAAASLLTTAADYGRFVAALVSGEGLRPATLAEALEPHVTVASRPHLDPTNRLSWGLGWGIQHGSAGRAIWQWGHNDGFRAFLIAYPDRRDAFVYFTNGAEGLSIAADLLDAAGEAAGWPEDEHWALRWLDYERHDAPARTARRELVRAFLDEGTEAGLAAFERLRARRGSVDDERLAARVGQALPALGDTAAGLALLERSVELHPASSGAASALGEALLSAGKPDRAIDSYRRALEIEPGDTDAARAIGWIEPLLDARERPPDVPIETLEAYAGDYGPRHVRLVRGELYYRRDGNPETRLVPIADDTFRLESTATFRIRFVDAEEGPAGRIIGLYMNGDRDESARDR